MGDKSSERALWEGGEKVVQTRGKDVKETAYSGGHTAPHRGAC